MTSRREVLLHGYAVKCDVDPSKTIRNPKVLSPTFADPCSRRMRSPNSSRPKSAHARSFRSRFRLNCRMGMSSPRVGRGHRISRNVQVGRPLLELRGRHVVALQVKAPQGALVKQLVDNVAVSFTSCLFVQNRGDHAKNRGILCSITLLVFPLTWHKLHVSLGDQIAHATWSWADTQDSSIPTQCVPFWSTQLDKSKCQKLDM